MENNTTLIYADSFSTKEKNEDACTFFNIPEKNANVIIVADGLGSMEHSYLASHFVVEFFKEKFKNELPGNEMLLYKLFDECNSALKKYAEQLDVKEYKIYNKKNALGTTLIIGIEFEDKFLVAYVGNGAIWHIKANFNHFNKQIVLFPWNAINLLNPHSIQDKLTNKEAIYNLFSLNDGNPPAPTIFSISKDKKYVGDILMICTDGVFSNDQLLIGKSKKDSILMMLEKSMLYFFEILSVFVQNKEFSQESIQAFIKNYLDGLKAQNLIDDDTTIGLIITDTALKYYLQRE